ncbi:hypothetical protein B0H34DRAFT_48463 [Crassisporium funariophilum]|nr:hypothetical protein B0H34DRAFT_48463 [Crassisporium funariophilum]
MIGDIGSFDSFVAIVWHQLPCVTMMDESHGTDLFMARASYSLRSQLYNMPRRARPTHRAAPEKNGSSKRPSKPIPKTLAPSKVRFSRQDSDESEEENVDTRAEDEDDDEGSSSGEFEEGSSQGSVSQKVLDREEEEDDEADADADAPRVAQWIDDEDDYLDESEEEVVEDEGLDEKTLRNDLQDLPLGALRRAQHVLTQAEPESDSESASDADSEGGSNVGPENHDTKGKGKEKERVEWSIKRRTDISKRSSKHAPTEVTSKRPVTRKRTVVEVPKLVARDPRFLPTAGEFSVDKFSQQYSFLADNHKKELATLRETLKQAYKLLASSPRDLRSEREHEVYRLEQAVKRAESLVNRDRLDQIQREALSKVKKEEHGKREQGKGSWYLKKADQQQLVMKARYEALAKDGGQRAVKKAIERKQKKVSQKEKRSRPYGKDGETPVKRRKLN